MCGVSAVSVSKLQSKRCTARQQLKLYSDAGIHGCQRSNVNNFSTRVRKLHMRSGVQAQQELAAATIHNKSRES